MPKSYDVCHGHGKKHCPEQYVPTCPVDPGSQQRFDNLIHGEEVSEIFFTLDTGKGKGKGKGKDAGDGYLSGGEIKIDGLSGKGGKKSREVLIEGIGDGDKKWSPEEVDFLIENDIIVFENGEFALTDNGEALLNEFQTYKNKDGMISVDDHPELAGLDTDGDSYVTFQEFVEFKNGSFGYLDKIHGGDGLSTTELETLEGMGIIREAGPDETPDYIDPETGKGYVTTENGEVITQRFAELDSNGDGIITKEEYVNYRIANGGSEEDRALYEQAYDDNFGANLNTDGQEGVSFVEYVDRANRFIEASGGDSDLSFEDFLNLIGATEDSPHIEYYRNLYNNVMDSDGNGGVTLAEYLEFQEYGYSERDFKAYDHDKSGDWDRTEYNDWFGDTFGGSVFGAFDQLDGSADQKIGKDAASAVGIDGDTFDAYDVDGDGFWSRDEYNQWLGDTAGEAAFSSADGLPQDELISFYEFVGIL